MFPLALILRGQGAEIHGSDRSYDQGRTPDKFSWLTNQGFHLFPQDGSGITSGLTALVVSTAVEDTIPDVKAAKEQGVPIITRAQLLSRLFNSSETRIAVAGTSGKSTTTGMIGYVLQSAGMQPTVMNGAIFRNFQTADNPYATALSGSPDLFVSEADESDGSIAYYNPTIAVLNNIALDHKTMDELIELFNGFVAKAGAAVLNLDNTYVADIAARNLETAMTYAIDFPTARLRATNIKSVPAGSLCTITDQETKQTCQLSLQVPGRHNIANALACIGACLLLGLDLAAICQHLAGFNGIKRRLEVVGEKGGVTVIDDFAHNPDKIAASLATLKESQGRLLVLFQIHGYNPIRLMRKEFADVFRKYLKDGDVLLMPEVLYLGGTVDRSVTAKDLISDIQSMGLDARWYETRQDILPVLIAEADPGARVIVMGARDDTLSEFARDILNGLNA